MVHPGVIAPVFDGAIRRGRKRLQAHLLGRKAKSTDELELIALGIEAQHIYQTRRKRFKHTTRIGRRSRPRSKHHGLRGDTAIDLDDGRGRLPRSAALGSNDHVTVGTLSCCRTSPILEVTCPSKLGEQTVTVSSGNASASFKVNVTNGTTYYSDNFQDNDLSDITISRQDKADQSQKLDGLDLNIGSKSSGGDKTSGYFLGNRNGKSFLACFAGNTSSASRGASIKFNEESYVPKFTELADNEKIVLNFDAYYHSEKDTMQIYGVTNSTNGASNKLIYAPYLSYQNNNSIPINECFTVNI